MDGGAQQAYLRIVDLAQNANGEKVRPDANQWLAGVDGLSPVKRLDARVALNATFTGFRYEKPADLGDGKSKC